MRFYWHYTTHAAFERAVRTVARRPFHKNEQVLLFAPQATWVPTFFSPCGERTIRYATEQEMLARRLYRFGLTESQLIPIARARLNPDASRARLDAALAVLANIGVDTTQWLALVGGINFFDAIIDRVEGGRWKRIKRIRHLATFGLVVLHEEPLEPEE